MPQLILSTQPQTSQSNLQWLLSPCPRTTREYTSKRFNLVTIKMKGQRFFIRVVFKARWKEIFPLALLIDWSFCRADNIDNMSLLQGRFSLVFKFLRS